MHLKRSHVPKQKEKTCTAGCNRNKNGLRPMHSMQATEEAAVSGALRRAFRALDDHILAEV